MWLICLPIDRLVGVLDNFTQIPQFVKGKKMEGRMFACEITDQQRSEELEKRANYRC